MAQILAGGSEPNAGGNTEVITQVQTANWTQLQGKPYTEISSKGIVNGLSNIPNDGADFGPDTTKGATALGQYGAPYTETSGINEGIASLPTVYNPSSARNVPYGVVKLINQEYITTYPIIIYTDWYVSIMGNIAPSQASNLPSRIAINAPYSALILGTITDGSTTPEYNGVLELHHLTFVTLQDVTDNFIVAPNEPVSTTPTQHYVVMLSAPFSTSGGTFGDGVGTLIIDHVRFVDEYSTDTQPVGNAAANIGNDGLDQLLYIDSLTAAGSISYNDIVSIVGWNHIYIGAMDISSTSTTVPSTYNGSYGLKIQSSGRFFFGTLHMIGCMPGVFWFTGSVSATIIKIMTELASPGSTTGIYGVVHVDGGNWTILNYTFENGFNPFTSNSVNIDAFGDTVFLRIPYYSNYAQGQTALNPPTISTNPPVSGTAYQNTNLFDIRLKIPVTYSPTSSAAATLATGTSSSSTVTTSTKVSYPAGITTGIIDTYEMVVPAGQYFELVVTNATIGTVEVEAA